MKVLIADDTDSVCYALRLALEYLGHEVIATAADGEDALEQYRKMQPELVFMDVRMPRMDGLTCTTRMSQLNPAARVVVITAGRTTETEARQAGARGFVEKPFELARLVEVIHEAA